MPTISPSLPNHDYYIEVARPTFLYVIYAILLWSIPIGVLGAISPVAAKNMAAAMTGYFSGLPEPLYTLFGAAYLGYTAARQWGKIGQKPRINALRTRAKPPAQTPQDKSLAG